MRDYGRVWVDRNGRKWLVSESRRALKFKIPCHAALRAEVFHRDGYRCVRCCVPAASVPDDYTGRYTLWTAASDALIVDHILTRPAGGRNELDNLQTLCEPCNKSKQVEDKAATVAYVSGAPA